MSHLKERKEKNCLNCNAVVQGRYCHICGQENIEPKESAWHLVSHFFQDITHFDGKFFNSLRYLIFRPGFLSREYMVGRRASHLNPIRMYVFTSAFFFLIFFSLFKFNPEKNISTTVDNGVTKATVEALRQMDAKTYKDFVAEVVKNDSSMQFAYDSAKYFHYLDSISRSGKGGFRFTPSNYKTRAAYDTALARGIKKHNWLERQLVHRQFELNEKYRGDNRAMFSAIMDKLMHSLPQILFITLPLFALLLKILYIRRSQYYYVNHAIFTIHLFVFVFIAMLVTFGIAKLQDSLHWSWLSYLNGLISILIFVYNYKAMRNFYQQGRAKTITKFLLLHLVNLFVVMILFVAFFMLSLFKV
ncbi:MAG: DUF3667 domain-containing protein [Ferruginibacter sp.]